MTRQRHLLPLLLAVATTLGACSLLPGDDDVVADGTVSPAPEAEPTAETTVPPSPQASPSPTAPATYVFLRVQFEDVIDDAELAALAELPGVADVLSRREDDGALWASRRADGTPVDDLPAEFKISVALEVERPALGLDLAAGEVAITTAGQQFRDLDVGSTVVLTDQVERTVVAVADDPALDDIEFVVAEEDAAALDVRGRQRGLLTLAPDADAEAVAAAAADLLGEDAITTVRVPDGRPIVLSLPATKARFGEFAFKDLPGRDIQAGVSWIRENIVDTTVPVLGRVVCHKGIIEPLTDVMEDLQASGLASEIDPDLYGGCWAPRRINKNANLSRHAWGIAVDVNVDFDAPGLGPIPSQGVIDAFARHGFRWGGDYPIPDNHHFEWVGTG